MKFLDEEVMISRSVFSGTQATHRKKTLENMSSVSLQTYSDALFSCLQGVYWEDKKWSNFKPSVENLARSLAKYAEYLEKNWEAMKRIHFSLSPIRQISDHLGFGFLPFAASKTPCLSSLERLLQDKEAYEYIIVDTLCPSEPSKKYEFIQKKKKNGLAMKTALLTYSHGNNIHFLWKVTDLSEEEFSRCQGTIERAKSDIPVYHTRAMKQALFARFGRVTSSVKPVVLGALYKELTDDHSASSNLHEAEIDERMSFIG